MNTQTTCRRARHTLRTIQQLRYNSTIVEPTPEVLAKGRNWKSEKPNYNTYGSKIWVYNHLQKNHMVYSLTKSMRVRSHTLKISLQWQMYNPRGMVNSANMMSFKEQLLPPPIALQWQENRPSGAPQRPLASLRYHLLLRLSHHQPNRLSNWAFLFPKATGIPSSPRAGMGRVDVPRQGWQLRREEEARSLVV